MVQFECPRVTNPLVGVIHFGVISLFLIFSPGRGNKNWAPQNKDQEVGIFLEQNQLNRLQMVQFEHPKYRNPCVSSTLG